MPWPSSQDYNEAVQNPAHCFADPDLQAAQAATNALGLPMPRSGNFADVYQLRSPAGRSWAVKCFTRRVSGLRDRYRAVSAHLAAARLPFTVDFEYLEQGVRVRGRRYPALKMHWVEGLLLNEFVRQHLDRPATLEALADLWARVGRRLRREGIAHGDLQHGNVLLVPGRDAGSLALRLIDYDGMWVPALAGLPSGEVGHPAYQHPRRLREQTYSAEVDRFPLLVVYTALRALAAGGGALWDRHDNGDNLLFSRQDFEAPGKSALFYQLLKLGDPAIRFLAENLIDAARKPLEETPLLEDLVLGGPASQARAEGTRAPPVAAEAPQAVSVVPLAAALAAEAAVGPTEAGPVPTLPDEERGPRWRATAPFWVALVGAVVLLGVLAGGIVLAAYFRAGGPRRRQAQAPSAPRVAVTKPAVATEEAPRPADQSNEPVPPAPAGEARRADPVGEIRRFVGHSGDGDGVVDVAFAPDGRTAVSGGQDKVLRLWDIETGREVRRFEGHAEKVKCLCFTPDGLHVVSGSDDKTLRLWDVASGKEVRRFEGHTVGLGWFVAVAHDGRQVISYCGGDDRTVRIWDLSSGKELRRFGYQGAGTADVGAIQAFSADGRLALTAGSDNALRLWDVGSGATVRVVDGQSGDGAFSADGRFVLAIGRDNYLRLYDVGSGNLICRFGQGPAVGHAALSPDGRRVLVSYNQKDDFSLWDVQSGREICRIAGNPKGVNKVRFSPDGRRALTAGRDGTIRLWGLPE